MSKQSRIVVIGGGISGINVALESSEAGFEVILLENTPTLGGRVSRFHQYFPKLCPPSCGLEINYRRLRANPKVEIHTNTRVQAISGEAGSFVISAQKKPRYITEQCVSCDACSQVCPAERSNSFNCGMNKTKAVFLPHAMAYPMRYAIDREMCQPGCVLCVDACKYGAIDLEMQPETLTLDASAVVLATGWRPYRASMLTHLGSTEHADVINNVVMERVASVNGPTQGRILRPSDQKPVESVAFVQCAGSRDENHLPYCSSICCLATLKQATYVLDQNPDAQVYIFYIDIRTPGKYEDFAARVQDMENVCMIKGKVASVSKSDNGSLVVEAEDMLNQLMLRREVDMVVLATGMEPNLKDLTDLPGIEVDADGFLQQEQQARGIYVAGVAKRPVDVNHSIQDATGAALKAVQTVLEN